MHRRTGEEERQREGMALGVRSSPRPNPVLESDNAMSVRHLSFADATLPATSTATHGKEKHDIH